MNHRRWRVLPSPPPGFLQGMGNLPLVNQLLFNRGITEQAAAESFLAIGPDLGHDPDLLTDMGLAVARIRRALADGEKIAVYGDFDADGICGTAVLVEGLSRFGGRMVSYFPHRVQEGYGLNTDSLDGLRAQGVSLVITVDCGISNSHEVAYARGHGLDIIITDHHNVMSRLPPALAVVNAKRDDSSYPFSQLAGVGVAYKLLQAVCRAQGTEQGLEDMLDLVAIGTVADKVPLLGENRYLVQKGLQVLRRTRRPGLRAMIDTCRLAPQHVDTEAISWTIAPRLNAPGRLDHAITTYRLIMSASADEARQLAQHLDEKNQQRQKLTEEFLGKAREQLGPEGTQRPALVVGGEDYPSGIAGLIAGRLAEEFYRPAFVYELKESSASGSARSIPEFDVVGALSQCRDLLQRFGGHPSAAGFALARENLPAFGDRLLEIAGRELAGVDLRPHLNVDAAIPLSSIGGKTYGQMERFAPFGQENPIPVLLSRRAAVVGCYPIGATSQHLRLRLRAGGITWRAIGFDLGPAASQIAPEIDVVYNLVLDRWNGEETLGLNVLDFVPSA